MRDKFSKQQNFRLANELTTMLENYAQKNSLKFIDLFHAIENIYIVTSVFRQGKDKITRFELEKWVMDNAPETGERIQTFIGSILDEKETR